MENVAANEENDDGIVETNAKTKKRWIKIFYQAFIFLEVVCQHDRKALPKTVKLKKRK